MKWAVRKLLLLPDDGGYQQIFFWAVEGSHVDAIEVAREVLTFDADGRYAVNVRPMQTLQCVCNADTQKSH